MFPHEKTYLFRNTAERLEYCVDYLKTTDADDPKWDNMDEEKAMHQIRRWCERYIEAYDDYHGGKPADD